MTAGEAGRTSTRHATLGLYTVGGSPEPIIASLKAEQPDRVVFIASPETATMVEQIHQRASAQGFTLGVGQYDIELVPDAQDFSACVYKMRELGAEVQKWLGRGNNYQVDVDFTGGTKCMSAALALVAQRWPCRFIYVGGTERTKDGMGVVVSGKEHIVHAQSPWNALGYRAVDDALVLFDQGAYAQAGSNLEAALQAVTIPEAKSELSALKLLCDAYDAWDRFNHRTARQRLADVLKRANDLRHLLGNAIADALLAAVQDSQQFLSGLEAAAPAPGFILDLLANAHRRGEQSRYDDGVARLYRAVEALAQMRLREVLAIEDSGEVPLDKVPKELTVRLGARAENGKVAVGLQDSYAILLALGDDLGKRFHDAGLDDRNRSPLVLRNSSILAHGFQPVSKNAFDQLFHAALSLARVTQEDLPMFIRFSLHRSEYPNGRCAEARC